MKRMLKKFSVLFVIMSMMFTVLITNVSADSWLFNSTGWRVRLDTPTTSKPYHHLHFYKGNDHIYCLRLDNMQPCDGTGGNVNKVPKWVKEKAMNDQRVKNAVAYHTPAIKSGWVRAIAKPLLVAGAGILVV